MQYIIGQKIGMSQIYGEDGNVLPVTLIAAGPVTITQVKSKESDGYTAVQLGFDEQKSKRLSRAERGHLGVKDDQKTTFRNLREFRLKSVEGKEKGEVFDVSVFQVGDVVDVRGVSKAKGFQGVVKRHNFRGGRASHGGKHNLRQPGSIGSAWPQRVLKGTRMAGRMGGDRVVVRNLNVAHVDKEENIIAIKGAVPGARGTLIEIRGHRKDEQ